MKSQQTQTGDKLETTSDKFLLWHRLMGLGVIAVNLKKKIVMKRGVAILV